MSDNIETGDNGEWRITSDGGLQHLDPRTGVWHDTFAVKDKGVSVERKEMLLLSIDEKLQTIINLLKER